MRKLSPERLVPLRRNLDFNKPFALLSAVAILGAFGGCSTEKDDAPKPPELQSVKSGTGDKNITLKINPTSSLGEGKHKLVVGVTMDCSKSGEDYTSVTIEGVVGGFESSICDVPQYDTFIIPPKDSIYTDNEIDLQVNTSRTDLQWIIGAETKG